MDITLKTGRIDAVDALRGFAVAAIMLLHFIEHFIYNVYPEPTSTTSALVNQGVWDALFFIFAGKSYTIFALLFGFTFIIQQQNQVARGADFGGRFAWRLVLLMLFATLNAAFFPGGDVLMLFAVMGFVMIPFRYASQRTLFIVSALFLIQPIEILDCFGLHLIPNLLDQTGYPMLKTVVDSGDFFPMLWANITTGQVSSLFWAVDAGRLLQAPGLFVLGMALARGGYFTRSGGFWVKVFVGGVVASFLLYVGKVASVDSLQIIMTMWYNIAFTAILVSAFIILYQSEVFRKMAAPLRLYGRMSLTNYVSQSIIGSIIFFPYAFGLADTLGIAWSFVVGLCVMYVQLWFCRLWLDRHKQGPLEGLWHRLTWIDRRSK